MKWVEILGLFSGIIVNRDLGVFISKMDYQAILGLYLGNNTWFVDYMCIFMNLFIKILTGVNIYELESCLRLFGVI